MKKYKVTIMGTGSCLMNKLSRDLNIEFGKIPKSERDDWQDKNYMKKCYSFLINSKPAYGFPEMNIHGLLVNACKKYKIPPPKDIGRTWTDYFKACVIPDEPAILQYSEIRPFGTMVNGNPSSNKKSSKVYTVRPEFLNWQTTLSFIDTAGRLNEEIVKGIMDIGGLFIGLSDWRPIYGRFKVIKVQGAGI